MLVDNYQKEATSVAVSPEEEMDVNECLLYKHTYF